MYCHTDLSYSNVGPFYVQPLLLRGNFTFCLTTFGLSCLVFYIEVNNLALQLLDLLCSIKHHYHDTNHGIQILEQWYLCELESLLLLGSIWKIKKFPFQNLIPLFHCLVRAKGFVRRLAYSSLFVVSNHKIYTDGTFRLHHKNLWGNAANCKNHLKCLAAIPYSGNLHQTYPINHYLGQSW